MIYADAAVGVGMLCSFWIASVSFWLPFNRFKIGGESAVLDIVGLLSRIQITEIKHDLGLACFCVKCAIAWYDELREKNDDGDYNKKLYEGEAMLRVVF